MSERHPRWFILFTQTVSGCLQPRGKWLAVPPTRIPRVEVSRRTKAGGRGGLKAGLDGGCGCARTNLIVAPDGRAPVWARRSCVIRQALCVRGRWGSGGQRARLRSASSSHAGTIRFILAGLPRTALDAARLSPLGVGLRLWVAVGAMRRSPGAAVAECPPSYCLSFGRRAASAPTAATARYLISACISTGSTRASTRRIAGPRIIDAVARPVCRGCGRSLRRGWWSSSC
jgi:hypothetical protein